MNHIEIPLTPEERLRAAHKLLEYKVLPELMKKEETELYRTCANIMKSLREVERKLIITNNITEKKTTPLNDVFAKMANPKPKRNFFRKLFGKC